MTRHEQARTYASAAHDGELDASLAAELAAHLGACAECSAFASALPRLTLHARELPEDAPSPDFAERVAAALAPGTPGTRDARATGGIRARRGRWLGAGGLAAAAVVALTLVVAGLPVRTFEVRPAGAAAALLRLRSLDVTRVIEGDDLDGARRIVERIRWTAPATTRVDRTIEREDGTTRREVEIRVPGREYHRDETGSRVLAGLLPHANTLPEPLSPSLALFGRDTGPGPTIAGRPTRRVEIPASAGVTRTAIVDARRSTVLSATTTTVLRKETTAFALTVIKRVTSIRYNPKLDASLFRIPPADSGDAGFRPRPPKGLSISPAREPDGFSVVSSGTDGTTEAILYAKRGFTIFVRSGHPAADERLTTTIDVTVGGTPATAWMGLYELPALTFERGGRRLTIAAPMTVQQLVATAESMYPR